MTGCPLLVVAIGGNALSPPDTPDGRWLTGERLAADRTGRELASLAARGYRLLVVHGNGPQVGRLVGTGPTDDLDIHVAQTQGELGYLLAAALEACGREPAVALMTRVEVDAAAAAADPDKPIGPILDIRPEGPALATGAGWRRQVPSPWPRKVLEQPSIEQLLERVHVIAAGGGGVPLAGGVPTAGVIDKDRVAALLAIELAAERLLIGTDVAGVYLDYGSDSRRLIPVMSVDECHALSAAGHFAPGSMGPKVASAASFVAATGRDAVICRLGELCRGLDGAVGTRISSVARRAISSGSPAR